MNEIVTFINSKGGHGKTTRIFSLALMNTNLRKELDYVQYGVYQIVK
jgi:cellulose biosynthesis protein BcsQ